MFIVFNRLLHDPDCSNTLDHTYTNTQLKLNRSLWVAGQSVQRQKTLDKLNEVKEDAPLSEQIIYSIITKVL